MNDQLFVAYAMLAYAVTMYIVMAYAMTSLIQTQPMWWQCLEGEDPETLSLFSSSLCAAPVDLHPQNANMAFTTNNWL